MYPVRLIVAGAAVVRSGVRPISGAYLLVAFTHAGRIWSAYRSRKIEHAAWAGDGGKGRAVGRSERNSGASDRRVTRDAVVEKAARINAFSVAYPARLTVV
jgi:hypothetical protein